LNDTHRAALAKLIENGPIPAIHGVVRWRLIDLMQWIFEEFRVSIAMQTLSRELRAMAWAGLLRRNPRPRRKTPIVRPRSHGAAVDRRGGI
jgi:hypothetical protein